ncbi:GFA family protein [Altererythrobacter sp. Root672]|uniref:GFA family protein n=1 Tax=Altererythrobacter sp. Root672 TaxID=1736584 RepID=UPI0006F80781|nr:GFA family protein [Altererythrobacter sp. Root672]KRA83097.1 aldehyde-activating protein [Altererythrobacter sp. Root672]
MEASCQCGNLSATIDDGAEPMTVLCHCRECQKRSGSPFGVMAYFPDANVTVTGEAREYSRPTDEGNSFTTGFCPACGSTLYGRASKYPGITGVTVGTIADPAFPPPARSVYEQSRHGWLALPETMPGFARGRDGERSR